MRPEDSKTAERKQAMSSFAPFSQGPASMPASSSAPFGSGTKSGHDTANLPLPRATALKWRVARVGLSVALLATLLVFGLGYAWLSELGVFDLRKEAVDLIVKRRPTDNTLVFDREGQKIGEFFNSYQVYVPFKELPKSLVDAIVAIEDRSFWTHGGFDPRGILRAAWMHVKGSGSKQGASTITQQVVRNFLLPAERTPERKIQEIALAMQLEKRLSKKKILEIYANSLFLGNGSYGVGAAAYRYFAKRAQDLEPHEAALIAGLFQSPSRYNPTRHPKRAKARQEQVLSAMQAAGMLTEQQVKDLTKRPLEYKEYKPVNTEFAPYFVDFVREQAKKILAEKKLHLDGQGLRIYTTLDVQLQKLAEESIAESGKLLDDARERTQRLRSKSGKVIPATLEAAILTTDPRTGEILAMVGGRDYQRTKFNRTYQALRSPGSAFKPVVYSLALEKRWKWSDVIFVSPVTINNYRPYTPDEDFLTETTLMRSFYRSMNTPTIELGEKLGLRPVIEQARRLGIRTPIKDEFGSMLGSSDTTMMDLARMYGAFANEGKLVEHTVVTKIVDRKGKVVYEAPPAQARTTKTVSPQIAYLMTQGMRAVLAMGTAYTSAKLSGVAAGKTGTSNNATDNWFCGYAPNLVSIVWVGTDEHASIHGDTTGAKLALPIWDKFMTKAFAVRKPLPFRAPPGVVTTYIHPKYGHRSPNGVRMYFLRGNEPPAQASALEALSQSADGYRDVFAH